MSDFAAPVPILRIFDEQKARDHYIGFLGFTVDWEHRFEPGTPIYMQISKGACVLHLSEHFGDGTPGTRIRIETADLDGYNALLLGKGYKYARPGIQAMEWGERSMCISDPFDNRLIFYKRMSSESLPSK